MRVHDVIIILHIVYSRNKYTQHSPTNTPHNLFACARTYRTLANARNTKFHSYSPTAADAAAAHVLCSFVSYVRVCVGWTSAQPHALRGGATMRARALSPALRELVLGMCERALAVCGVVCVCVCMFDCGFVRERARLVRLRHMHL